MLDVLFKRHNSNMNTSNLGASVFSGFRPPAPIVGGPGSPGCGLRLGGLPSAQQHQRTDHEADGRHTPRLTLSENWFFQQLFLHFLTYISKISLNFSDL